MASEDTAITPKTVTHKAAAICLLIAFLPEEPGQVMVTPASLFENGRARQRNRRGGIGEGRRRRREASSANFRPG